MTETGVGPARLSIFNHKGGVGKTTLTMNLGAALAALGRRVLLVDTDPQCNLTSYLIDDDVVDDLLDHSDSPEGQTIWSAVKPLSEASGGIKDVEPIETGVENLFLIPGDIRLSEFESDLNDFWGECLQRKIRGFRGTNALSDLVTKTSEGLSIDYVFYDSGPNIGPLNRVILLDCDYFIVPVACDLFSLRALKTLGRTMVDWIQSWETIRELAPEDLDLFPGRPSFLGYIPQNYKIYAGAVVQQQSDFLTRIDKEVKSQVISLLDTLDPALISTPRSPKLGQVQHLGSLATASQREGLPLFEVSGGSPEHRAEAQRSFSSIAKKIDDLVQS